MSLESTIYTLRILIEDAGLVGRPELPELWGVSLQRVREYEAMEGFPKPIHTMGKTPIYLLPEVQEWKRARERAWECS